MYQNRHNYILGFHGCDKSTVEKIVNHREEMKPSENTYDWLGSGLYFWENNHQRALEWVTQQKEKFNKFKEPAVLGAIICLGNCCDFLDSEYLNLLKVAYETLAAEAKSNIPENKKDLRRYLDCAVIEALHRMREEMRDPPFDSVRSLFVEGEPPYPGAGFLNKNHIQICIRNPNCIKGYFIPRTHDNEYSKT